MNPEEIFYFKEPCVMITNKEYGQVRTLENTLDPPLENDPSEDYLKFSAGICQRTTHYLIIIRECIREIDIVTHHIPSNEESVVIG